MSAAGMRRCERGSVTIQMVILLPAVFALMFVGMQAALHYQARTLALAAAQEGAREAGSESGTKALGEATTRQFLADAAPDVLLGPTVDVQRTSTTATVVVVGRTLSVIPGWRGSVTQSASVPVERLTQ